MDILIREMKIEDIPDITALHILSWQSAYRGIVPDHFLNSLDIEERIERNKQYFYTNDGITIYCIMAKEGPMIGELAIGKSRDNDIPQAGEIIGIYLLPEYWGMGCGKKAMDFAVSTLRELGFSTILLWVFEDNIRAREFYEKYGFRIEGKKEEVTFGKQLTEIRYILV
jgi:RimJ/RimL family protein N-acetyltransferase